MKRGTESIVRLGKGVEPADFSGINVLSTVILGKKESATKDFNGLFITDAVLLGKKISHSAVVTATVHGVSPLSLPSAVANSLAYVKAFGGTEQNGTPTPDAPMDIVSNNGVLKVRQNLWKGNYTDLGYLDETGAVIPTNGYMASDFIEIDQSKKYTFYEQIVQTYTGNGMRICFYNSSKQMVGQRQGDSAINVGAYAYIATPPANAKYIRVSTGVNTNYVTNITLVEGEYNTTTIQGAVGSIYTDGTVETIEDTIGNTATAEMLLKVGDYQDVQSIIDGAITRNIGVLVLDGTEDWVTSSGSSKHYAYFYYSGINANTETELYCTHFGVSARNTPEESKMCVRLNRNGFLFCNNLLCADNTTWTQYLADQYAAGTPVIIVYPLATPTTESVTGQTLQVQDGDNTLEITQASMDGLELEAQYQKREQ